MKVLFIDDRVQDVVRQWHQSGCESSHELLRLEPFETIERTCHLVSELEPDIIVIGYGLNKPVNGVDVVVALRKAGYNGFVIANSGDRTLLGRSGVTFDGSANRSSHDLRRAVDNLKGE